MTLLTIFSRPQTDFPFDELLSKLTLSNSVDLLRCKLLDAKIDEERQVIVVSRVAPRCIREDKNEVLAIVEEIRAIRRRLASALEIAKPRRK